MPRRRRFAASKWRTRHGSAAASKPVVMSPGSTRPTTITSPSTTSTSRGDVSGNRLNNAPEWAGRLWIEWTRRHRPIETTVDRGRHDGAVHGVLHAVQRRHPATASVWPARRARRIRPQPSPVDSRRVRPKPHEHGLRHGDVRDGTDRLWRTSRAFAAVRDQFHRPAIRTGRNSDRATARRFLVLVAFLP